MNSVLCGSQHFVSIKFLKVFLVIFLLPLIHRVHASLAGGVGGYYDNIHMWHDYRYGGTCHKFQFTRKVLIKQLISLTDHHRQHLELCASVCCYAVDLNLQLL